MLITQSDNKIVFSPVPSFTTNCRSDGEEFGKSAEDVQKHLDEGRKDDEIHSPSA